MIKISVIMAVYNSEKYLKECLDSLLSQSLKEIEIICVDDASEDNTAAILEQYRIEDSRIRILRNEENCGAGASRNRGLSEAEGEYLIFLDADDYFEQDMLLSAWKKAVNGAVDVCIFKEDSFWDDGDGVRVFGEYSYVQNIMKGLAEKCCFSPTEVKEVLFNLWNGWAWDKLFRKAFVEEKGLQFQELRTTNDAFFVHAALAGAERIAFINDIYVHHRVEVITSLSNRRDSSWEGCCLYLKKLKLYLEKQKSFDLYGKSFINWAANFLYWNFWTLNHENRQKLFYALKESMIGESSLSEYTSNMFYHAFDEWFVRKIAGSRTLEACGIPIDEMERWNIILQIDKSKVDQIFQYADTRRYGVAVWGIGKRGSLFLDKYGNQGKIKKVYDMDPQKIGKKTKSGYRIEEFNPETGEGIHLILVMGASYYKTVAETVRTVSAVIKVLDVQSYLEPFLSYPLSLEDCIL